MHARDYAYGRPDCKKLRDGTHENAALCKYDPEGKCRPEKSFRNADTLAFVAAGVYWEAYCEKEIGREPADVTSETVEEDTDPIWNDDSVESPPNLEEGEGLTAESDETLVSPEAADPAPNPEAPEIEADKPTPPKEVSCETSDGSPDTKDITDAINELRDKNTLCRQETPEGPTSRCTRVVDQGSAAISICGAVDPIGKGHTCKEISEWANTIQQTCLDGGKGKAGGTYNIDEGQRVVVFNNKDA